MKWFEKIKMFTDHTVYDCKDIVRNCLKAANFSYDSLYCTSMKWLNVWMFSALGLRCQNLCCGLKKKRVL